MQAARKTAFQTNYATPTKSILKKRLLSESCNSVDLRSIRALKRSQKLANWNIGGDMLTNSDDMNFFAADERKVLQP